MSNKINYNRLEQLVFILWDNYEDYNDEDTQIRIGNSFKNKHRVYNDGNSNFEDVFGLYKQNPNQEFLFFIHLDHSKNDLGLNSFLRNSGILKAYPNLKYYFVSRFPKKEIYRDNLQITVYDWGQLYEEVDHMFIPQTISEMKDNKSTTPKNTKDNTPKLDIKYAIFTALYKDEYQEVEKLFEWEKEKNIETDTAIYNVGKIPGTNKYVVANFATKTGMVEAAILCTEIINLFKPDYLLMPGVCGGSDKTELGDIIVANKVFLLGKGKISDPKEKIKGKTKKASLLYKNEAFNPREVKNSNGDHVNIIIEEFESEINSIDLDDKLHQIIEPQLKKIQDKINIPYKIDKEKTNILFDPIACSLSVIDKEDYFDIEIKDKDRKTKAVEMESYGVARAAQKANGGKTKFLIFKSVMDKTKDKTDGYKSKAAYISAQFLKYLLEENII